MLSHTHHGRRSADILAPHQNSSRTVTLMRAIRNLNITVDWLTSLTGKVRERETHQTCYAVRFRCRRVSLQACMCRSAEIKTCFYISKFCYPQQASLYSENLQTMTETEKQLLSQNSGLWRRLGKRKKDKKKKNTALSIYHVYIINCAIYITLMKDDEIISHLQRKSGKCEMNYPATRLVL